MRISFRVLGNTYPDGIAIKMRLVAAGLPGEYSADRRTLSIRTRKSVRVEALRKYLNLLREYGAERISVGEEEVLIGLSVLAHLISGDQDLEVPPNGLRVVTEPGAFAAESAEESLKILTASDCIVRLDVIHVGPHDRHQNFGAAIRL